VAVQTEHTPLAQASPSPAGEVASRSDDGLVFRSITERYEQPVDEQGDGFRVVLPLLEGDLPEGFGEDLSDISLETPEQQKAFDDRLLPVLKKSFASPTFVPSQRLLAGDSGVNYRGLRQLVTLLGMRAEQLWADGDKKGAIELASLPLSLARAMRSRPETASVNLFSSSYAESSLSLIQEWSEESSQDPEMVESLSRVLRENTPSYQHLQETVVVDFAQLTNSLQSDDGRKLLGIGQVEDATLATWTEQLADIFEEAEELYGHEPTDAEDFNEKVMSAAVPIQGLVIDYPEVSTMQKHSFVKYKATELGVALLGSDGQELRALPSEELIGQFFDGDEASSEVLKSLIRVEADESSIRVLGQAGQFEMLAPGVEPVFFEFQSDSPE